MKKLLLGLIVMTALTRCAENDVIAPLADQAKDNESGRKNARTSNVYFVSITGNDATADGTTDKPARTIKYAMTKVPANMAYTVVVGAGTFVETGMIEVPPGVGIEGAGIGQTIIKAASNFYYHPTTPAYAFDKFLFSLSASSLVAGNQLLTGFTIDGDSKQLHGGIYVKNRSNVTIDGVKVQFTNFTGIWLWDVKDSKLLNTELLNCSWGSANYCSGALNLGNLEQVEISQLNIDESTGYGIKAIGPDGATNILNSQIHDSHISVNPIGLWNNGTAPNIAIELWSVNLVGCEIYNTYVDNTISLVNSNAPASNGVQSIRVHHNIIDMETRAHGAGYAIELTLHDVEIDHNYIYKGNYGIANWDNPRRNWSIHHNTFYAMQGTYPGEVVRSQWSGLHNVKLYNNTVEFAGDKTMNVIGMYSGTGDNVDIQNNLFINNNTGYSYYPNQLAHLENGAVLTNLKVRNNLFQKLPIGSVTGTYSNNLIVDPQISKTGNRADPYYMPKTGSPLIDAGANVGFPYTGLAPDIGAFENGITATTNAVPKVNINSPVNTGTFPAGATVIISATATDIDGSISKVEFYSGITLLGSDATSPYSFTWTNVPSGNYPLTAKATDNQNAVTTSAIVNIVVGTVLSTAVTLGLEAIQAVLSGKMTIGTDANAGAGNFFSVPSGNGKNYYIPPQSAASFSFQLSTTDSYVIWAKVKTATDQNQTSFIYNGSGKWFTWAAGVHTSWTWVKITDGGSEALFPFKQGSNNFQIGWFDDNVKIDQLLITNDRSYQP